MNYRGLIAVDQIGVSSATAKMMRDGLAQYDAIQKKNVPTLYHQLETSGPYNLVIIMAGTRTRKWGLRYQEIDRKREEMIKFGIGKAKREEAAISKVPHGIHGHTSAILG